MDLVFALGSNGAGQLGIGHKEDVSVPKPVEFAGCGSSSDPSTAPAPPESPIVKVAAGGNHTLLLTSRGGLYWAGDSSTGSCGHVPHQTSACKPALRRAQLLGSGDETGSTLPAVRLVAATWEASIFAVSDEQGRTSRMYSCGCGTKGELAQGPFVVRVPSAQPIPDFPPPGTELADLAACMSHVVAVLSNGDAYGWGNGRKGQLGTPDAIVDKPRKFANVGFRVARAVCGKDFTCLVGDPAVGELLILGSDKWGVRTSAPASITGWKDVQASWGNVFVLRSDGTLLGWGRNDHGQLPTDDLPKISRIAAGSEHVVALTDASDVIAWGWGEHGNCGPQVEDGDVKGRWNVIASHKYMPPGSIITAIGAGCATSWIVIHVPALEDTP